MDIMTLDKTTYASGAIINNLDSVLWVERYLEPGEFKIICDPTSKLRSKLALGTFISHTNTTEVMVVENHQITESFGASPKLEVTGRSLDCFLEKRVISVAGTPAFNQTTKESNDIQVNGNPSAVVLYLLSAYFIGSTLTSNNVVPNVSIIVDTTIPTASTIQRSFKKGAGLHQALLDILGSSDLGIRFERPLRDKNGTALHHYNNVTDPTASNLAVYIHAGVDRSSTISFLYGAGDIQEAKYFWSNKTELNCINGSTYYVELTNYFPSTPKTGWDNKTGYADVTQVNQVPSTLGAIGFQQAAITQEATELYSKTKSKVLMEATVSRVSRYAYREDYIVGDLVYVVGNYGVASKMRVVENVESQDEFGYNSHPTLKAL
jgi:hypothetical protein